MKVKTIVEWSNIFLDTSVIINLLLKKQNPETLNETCIFTHRLIKYLSESKNGESEERQFYISSITISEIFHTRSIEKSIATRIVDALASENVIFVDFDNDIAELVTEKYNPILGGRKELNEFAKKLSWPEHGLVTGREWLTKDALILASCEYHNCDVIITHDHNTLYPVAEKVGVFTAICENDLFETTDKYILGYYHDNAKKKYSKLK